MNTINLSPRCITDFTEQDTIYIETGNKDHKSLKLCQFSRYRGNRVYGVVINDKDNTEISAHIEKCALYGENPVSGKSYYHWFKKSGFAIYPSEFNKENENAEIIKEHPSFGLVGLSRRNSRGTVLFGSSITHNEIIALTIRRGEVDRHLSREWYHGKEELIEIEMSSNQFAEFITTPNVGSGVPCTIRHFNGNSAPEPPYENRKDMYSKEFEKSMKNLGADLNNSLSIAKTILQKPTINKGDKEELLKLFDKFITSVSSNIPFIENSFVEQMDKTVTEAKGEIEAFITRRLTEEGRKVLLGETGDVKLLLESPKDEI